MNFGSKFKLKKKTEAALNMPYFKGRRIGNKKECKGKGKLVLRKVSKEIETRRAVIKYV
jgi:hypothetical protein